MKKWIIMVAASVLLAAIISLLKIDVTSEKKVIYIEGGEPVLADSVNQTDQFVYYEIDGKAGMFMIDDVTSVGAFRVEPDVEPGSSVIEVELTDGTAIRIDG